MIIEGTITRQVDPGNGKREVEIPFLINTETGTYSQWGHDTMILGENVDFLESLRNAACEAAADEDADDTMGSL
ncbi:hypothetical protein ACFV6Y_38570 [Streptomyces massasporeus]|uniref:hypothetical protein n=1 Tax=Streptomyces massasporeus TaxID=67324 RepID=UPI0036531CAD